MVSSIVLSESGYQSDLFSTIILIGRSK